MLECGSVYIMSLLSPKIPVKSSLCKTVCLFCDDNMFQKFYIFFHNNFIAAINWFRCNTMKHEGEFLVVIIWDCVSNKLLFSEF